MSERTFPNFGGPRMTADHDQLGRQVDQAIHEQLTRRSVMAQTAKRKRQTRSEVTTVILALFTLIVCAALFGLLWRVFAWTAGIGG